MGARTKRATDDLDQHLTWFRGERPLYEAFARTLETLISEILRLEQIDSLTVTSRVKSLESFAEKIRRKSYREPQIEMTDLCGLRIITYIEDDVERVAQATRRIFEVDEARSMDKTSSLSVNQVGYRSIHFVCSLGRDRIALPEYSTFSELRFELQIRTALQHAWAQIEHDRNYKFAGVLPPSLQRRLYLAAGLLEFADREFNQIAREIDLHARDVDAKTTQGELEIPLDSVALEAYLRNRLQAEEFPSIRFVLTGKLARNVLDEMKRFGLETIADVDKLLTREFLTKARALIPNLLSDAGILRNAMMYTDLHRYLESAWTPSSWRVMLPDSAKMLGSKYGDTQVESALKKHNIERLKLVPKEIQWEDSSN